MLPHPPPIATFWRIVTESGGRMRCTGSWERLQPARRSFTRRLGPRWLFFAVPKGTSALPGYLPTSLMWETTKLSTTFRYTTFGVLCLRKGTTRRLHSHRTTLAGRLPPCIIPAMPDFSLTSLILVLLLFLLWNLELVATLLDRKAEPQDVPAPLRDVMDAATLLKGRMYRMECSRFHIFQSALQLAILLGFWFAGGFAWLDTWVRSFAGNGIPAGLTFLSLWFLAQSLISLPFDIWHTFVLENRYGFNRSTPATFILDRLKGLLLAAVIGLPLMAALLWILGSLSHAWLWAWLVLAAFQGGAKTRRALCSHKLLSSKDGPPRCEVTQLRVTRGIRTASD